MLTQLSMRSPTPSDSQRSFSGRESVDFDLLLLIEKEPGLPQRELAKRLGISLGRVNYCLKGLVSEGLLKLDDAPKKVGNVYALTPSGSAHRSRYASHFLKRKLLEFEKLKSQIEALKGELSSQ